MTKNRDELLTQFGRSTFAGQGRFALHEPINRIEMGRYQFCEQFERPNCLQIIHLRRARVDGAKGAEERSVSQNDRNRNITLKAVLGRCVVSTENFVFGNMIDSDGLMALSNFVTDRRFNDKLIARLKAKLDFVPNRAAYPPAIRHSCDGSKAHSSGTANYLENARHGIDALDSVDVRCEVCIHQNQLICPDSRYGVVTGVYRYGTNADPGI